MTNQPTDQETSFVSKTFLKSLVELNTEAKEAHKKYLGLKEETKDAKDAWEGLVLQIQERLSTYEQESTDPNRLPFDDDDDGGGDDGDPPIKPAPDSPGGDMIDVEWEHPPQPALQGPAVGHPVLEAVKTAVGADAWRKVPIDRLGELGCSDKTVQALIDDGIQSIGDLADRNSEMNNLTKIPGIGEAKAGEIEEAITQFWTAWNKDPIGAAGGMTPVESRPKKSRKKAKGDSEAA